MLQIILLMIAGAGLVSFWNGNRAAAEYAYTLGRRACGAAGVQFLDDSVHANGYALRRDDRGRLGFDRKFRFEFSSNGADRHAGALIVRDGKLVFFQGPERVAPVVVPLRRDSI